MLEPAIDRVCGQQRGQTHPRARVGRGPGVNAPVLGSCWRPPGPNSEHLVIKAPFVLIVSSYITYCDGHLKKMRIAADYEISNGFVSEKRGSHATMQIVTNDVLWGESPNTSLAIVFVTVSIFKLLRSQCQASRLAVCDQS